MKQLPKSLFALTSAAGMAFTGMATTAYAATADAKNLEQAILTAKNVATIPKEYTDFRSSSRSHRTNDGGSVLVWNLSWKPENSRSEGIDLSVDALNNIVQYSKYDTYEEDNGSDTALAKVFREEGKKAAETFMKKAVGSEEIASHMQLVEYADADKTLPLTKIYTPNDTHTYVYRYYHEDIPVDNLTVQVNVSKQTGEVVGYQGFEAGTVIPSSFSSTNGLLGIGEARVAYLNKIGLNLSYLSRWDEKAQKYVAFAAYVPEGGDTLGIDAKTGNLVRLLNGNPVVLAAGESESAADMGASSMKLSPEEQGAVNKISGLISQANAEAAVKKAFPNVTGVSKSASLSQNWREKNKYVWSLSFSDVYATVDAKSGELISVSLYDDGVKNGGKTTEAQARKTAETFLKTNLSGKYGQSKLHTALKASNDAESEDGYSFTFYRQVNGVDFRDNYLQVSVNAAGDVTSMRSQWYDGVVFPSLDKAIDSTQAYEKLNAYGQMSLHYGQTKDNKTDLFWYFQNNVSRVLVDPFTGTLLNWDGTPYIMDTQPAYTDISGHAAEKEITTLLESGYYLPGSQFNPGKIITQEAFLRYLYCPDNYVTRSQDALYEAMARYGVIKSGEKNPTAALSRQDAAKILVRYLGLEKAAAYPDIYKLSVKDSVSKSYQGYVAMALAMHLIETDESNNVNATASMTNADAAIAIYQALIHA